MFRRLPWNGNHIISRDDINISLYQRLTSKGHIDIELIKSLSRSECIGINDVIMHPEIPWDYKYLSMNPNITWKIINNYPNLPWDFNNISLNEMTCPMECKYYRSIYDEIIREINYIN